MYDMKLKYMQVCTYVCNVGKRMKQVKDMSKILIDPTTYV